MIYPPFIFLTGFMGAGKTTAGRELAKRLRLPFVDTDEHIIQEQKMSIKDIFEQKGETAFRNMEEEVIMSLSDTRAVVSTGGGVVINEENRKRMHAKGVIIFLYCGIHQTEKRLREDSTRPMLNNKHVDTIKCLMEERLPYYLTATHTINTSFKDISSILNEMMILLNK